jgi:hypothetical protein
MIKKSRGYRLGTLIVSMACLLNLPALAAEPAVVNVDNFARAETAAQFDRLLQIPGAAINTVVHYRDPVALDSQNVIRLYQPRKEILEGTWTFPKVTPVQ